MVGPVTAATTAWMDRWWDDEAGLLWNPPGSFEGVLEPRSVHLVRETAWYAIGLLRRDGPGDRAGPRRRSTRWSSHQYDEPGQPWHGTFVRFPEWARAHARARPSGSTTTRTGGSSSAPRSRWPSPTSTCPPASRARAREAVHLAVDAEPPDRVPPTYANIALLARVAGGVGRASRRRLRRAPSSTPSGATAASASTARPPTTGSICWRSGSGSDPMPRTTLRRDGAAVEAALWNDIARWWHAGLGNLCGPYSRAYGMDLGAYVSGLVPRAVVRRTCPPRCRRWTPTSCPTATTCAWPRCSSTSACGCRRRCGPPSSASTAPARSRQVDRRRAAPGGHGLARGRT